MKTIRLAVLLLIGFLTFSLHTFAQAPCSAPGCCSCVEVATQNNGGNGNQAVDDCTDGTISSQCSGCSQAESLACLPISDYKYAILGGALLIGGYFSRKIF